MKRGVCEDYLEINSSNTQKSYSYSSIVVIGYPTGHVTYYRIHTSYQCSTLSFAPVYTLRLPRLDPPEDT